MIWIDVYVRQVDGKGFPRGRLATFGAEDVESVLDQAREYYRGCAAKWADVPISRGHNPGRRFRLPVKKGSS